MHSYSIIQDIVMYFDSENTSTIACVSFYDSSDEGLRWHV